MNNKSMKESAAEKRKSWWMTAGILLAVFLVVLTALSVLAYQSARRDIINAEKARMEEWIAEAAEDVQQFHQEAEATVQALAGMAGVMAMDGEKQQKVWDQGGRRELLSSFVDSQQQVYSGGIWFLPKEGEKPEKYNWGYASRENGKTIWQKDLSDVFGMDQDYAQKSWFKKASAGQGGIFVDEPYFVDSEGITAVTYAAPFYDKDRQLLGVVTADIDLSKLNQRLIKKKRMQGQGEIFVIASDGTYLIHEDPQKQMKRRLSEDLGDLGVLGRDILNASNEASSEASDSITFSDGYRWDGNNQYVWYSSRQDTGWTVAAAVPQKALADSLKGLGKKLSMASLVLLLFGTAASLLLLWIGGRKKNSPAPNGQESDEFDFDGIDNLEKRRREKKQGVERKHLAQLEKELSVHMEALEMLEADVERMAVSIENPFADLETLDQMLLKSNIDLEENSGTLKRLSETMQIIHQQSEGIEKLLGQVGDNAGAANRLSVNAAIEASRAGEAGAAFIPIAEKMREIANQSAVTVQEMIQYARSLGESVSQGMDTAGAAKEACRELLGHTDVVVSVEQNIKKQSGAQVAVWEQLRKESMESAGKIKECMTAVRTIVSAANEMYGHLEAHENQGTAGQETQERDLGMEEREVL